MIAGKGGHYNGPFTNLKVGDSFYVHKNILRDDLIKENDEKDTKLNFNKEDMAKVKVVAIVNTPPYGFFVNPEHLKIIATKDVLGNIAGKDMNKALLDGIKSAEIDLKDKSTVDEFQKWIQLLGDRVGVKDVNHVQQMEEQKSRLLQMKILMYGNGYDVCKYVRGISEVPIIFLTACDDEVNIILDLDIGADDYITKPFRVRELISRIKAIQRRFKSFENSNDKRRDS